MRGGGGGCGTDECFYEIHEIYLRQSWFPISWPACRDTLNRIHDFPGVVAGPASPFVQCHRCSVDVGPNDVWQRNALF